MKVVYIAGPYRASTPWGIEQNVRLAETMALKVWQTSKAAALCPHTMTRYYQESAPDEVWLRGTLELLKRCDAIFLLEGWQRSEGSKLEHQTAVSMGMPVFTNLVDLNEWLATV